MDHASILFVLTASPSPRLSLFFSPLQFLRHSFSLPPPPPPSTGPLTLSGPQHPTSSTLALLPTSPSTAIGIGGGYDSSHHSHSGEKKRSERAGFDWDLMNMTTDQRMQQSRQTAFPASIGGLQRQSSGSSYGESSISGDYFLPSLSAAVNSRGGDPNAYAHLPDGGGAEVLRLKSSEATGGGGGGGTELGSKAIGVRFDILWLCMYSNQKQNKGVSVFGC